MQVSDEFFKFCSGLHQDFQLYGPAPGDWIRGALQFVQKDRWPLLSSYLDDLLAQNYSDAQLQDIYRSTHTELRIWQDHEMRPFLAMVRDTVNAELNK